MTGKINLTLHPERLVLFCIPKVANTSIKQAVLEAKGWSGRTFWDQLRATPAHGPALIASAWKHKRFGLKRLYRPRKAIKPGIWEDQHNNPNFTFSDLTWLSQRPDYLKIAVVRNPFDRLVSCYRSKLVESMHGQFAQAGLYRDMPFDAFAAWVAEQGDEGADLHIRSQASLLLDDQQRLVPDMVASFERLGEDWPQVQTRVRDHCGLALPDLPRLNTTASRAYQAYYNPRTRALIAHRYARDLDLFGYSF